MTSTPLETVVVDGLALAQSHPAGAGRSRRAPPSRPAAGRRCLAVVLVGDDPASASYIKGKRRACERIGMDSVEHDLPAEHQRGGRARRWSSA